MILHKYSAGGGKWKHNSSKRQWKGGGNHWTVDTSALKGLELEKRMWAGRTEEGSNSVSDKTIPEEKLKESRG